MTWETRRALRWGSAHINNFETKELALFAAKEDILNNGNNGRIELVDEKDKVVYYDIYEEMS